MEKTDGETVGVVDGETDESMEKLQFFVCLGVVLGGPYIVPKLVGSGGETVGETD